MEVMGFLWVMSNVGTLGTLRWRYRVGPELSQEFGAGDVNV